MTKDKKAVGREAWMTKCNKCLLTPDMCGAKCEQDCDRIYENKTKTNLSIFAENVKFAFEVLAILGVLVVVLLLAKNNILPWG